MAPNAHRWQFFRSGGFDQARLDTADDLANLADLDQTLWAALACPVKGLELDERTLALIDADGDGRVRAPEVIAAVAWVRPRLKDLAMLKAGSDALPLVQVDGHTEEGRAILLSARQVLKELGKADANVITLADLAETAKMLAGTRFNGDGVVPPESAGDEATRKVLEEIVATEGAVPDRSGKAGVDQAKLDLFFTQLAAFSDWTKTAETDAAIRPLGEPTDAAADAWRAVRAKIDDYFARCRLAAFDPRAVAAVNRQEAEYIAVASKDISAGAQELAGFPIARADAGRPLPLAMTVNPAWAAALTTFRNLVVTPLLGAGRISLTPEDWAEIGAKFAAHDAWLAAKPAVPVATLGLARIREILAGPAKDEIAKLLASDKALEKEFEALAQVERLLRYQRDLYRLLHNFVNFADFYSPERWATFQTGTLYLDARACELCVRVDDPAKHAALAGLAQTCLAYCDCTRAGGEKLHIAAAFTAGDSDYLMVGRNGVFYDRAGRDWDATITKVVMNPISVGQAFWTPYKRLVRLMEERAAKRAAEKDAESDAQLAGATAPAAPKKIDVGTMAAIGLAIGAIGTLIVTLFGYVTGLFALPFWQIVLVFCAILLLISGPSMLIAWLKLRQRNLGPILDAGGWAVNGRVKMNVRFGRTLTKTAHLPPNAVRESGDPFGQPPAFWPKAVLFVVIVCFVWSFLDDHHWIHDWTHGRWGTPRPPQKVETAKPETGKPETAKPETPEPAPQPPK